MTSWRLSKTNIADMVRDILCARNARHPFDMAIIPPPANLQPRDKHMVFTKPIRVGVDGIDQTKGLESIPTARCCVVIVMFSDVAVDYYIRNDLTPELIENINNHSPDVAFYDDYEISRKEIAVHAGLGKISKSSLFFSRKYGLNCKIDCLFLREEVDDMDTIFDVDTSYRDGSDAWKLSMCRDCDICVKSCPVDAFDNYTMSKEGAIRCDEHITPMWNQPEKMCRNCITSCPYSETILGNIYAAHPGIENTRLEHTIDTDPMIKKM